jgi:hypothetical protein
MPAQQHTLEQSEHHSDVERALVVGDDERAAFVRPLPVDDHLRAKDAQKAASQTR